MEHSSPFALRFKLKKGSPFMFSSFTFLIALAVFHIITIYSSTSNSSFLLPFYSSSTRLEFGALLLYGDKNSSTNASTRTSFPATNVTLDDEQEKILLVVDDEAYQNTMSHNATAANTEAIVADVTEIARYHKNNESSSIESDAANKTKYGDDGHDIGAYGNAAVDEQPVVEQKSCLLALNSKDWLDKPRYGNEPSNFSQNLLSSSVGFSPLLDHLEDLLGHQKICHERSLFKSLENSDVATKDETLLIRMWKIRLMYAAFYHHQHEHAVKEARDRIEFESSPSTQNNGHSNCHDDMKKYKLGSFDYECRNAKLIVAEIRNTGIGSLIKRDLFNIFMAGIALNRTVVLYNSLGKEGFWSVPWKLSSCPRRDYQCTFRPVSGCVPLLEEIYNATLIGHKDIEKYLNQFHNPIVAANNSIAAPPPEDESRVIHYSDPFYNFLKISPKFLNELNRIAHSIIDELDPGDGRIPVLRKAAEEISSDNDVKSFKKFDHEYSDSMISFILYFLRPREDKARLLEEFMAKDLPEHFDSTRTLGLPFRGSDKCNQESECLTFPTYMKLLKSRWFEEEGLHQGHSNETNVTANIIVTSEVPNIMELARDFSTNELYQNKMPFHINWITNTNDVHQANGNSNRPILTEGTTADDVMLSILSSFKLQMNAAATIGNCCSNFHQTIFHLLRGGCGLHIDNTGQCLQYRKESIYQLCCDVKVKRSCVKRRLLRLRKEYNDANITISGVEAKLWEE